MALPIPEGNRNPFADMIFQLAVAMNTRHATLLRQEAAAYQPTTLAARDPEAPTGSETPRKAVSIAKIMEVSQ